MLFPILLISIPMKVNGAQEARAHGLFQLVIPKPPNCGMDLHAA